METRVGKPEAIVSGDRYCSVVLRGCLVGDLLSTDPAAHHNLCCRALEIYQKPTSQTSLSQIYNADAVLSRVIRFFAKHVACSLRMSYT